MIATSGRYGGTCSDMAAYESECITVYTMEEVSDVLRKACKGGVKKLQKLQKALSAVGTITTGGEILDLMYQIEKTLAGLRENIDHYEVERIRDDKEGLMLKGRIPLRQYQKPYVKMIQRVRTQHK